MRRTPASLRRCARDGVEVEQPVARAASARTRHARLARERRAHFLAHFVDPRPDRRPEPRAAALAAATRIASMRRFQHAAAQARASRRAPPPTTRAASSAKQHRHAVGDLHHAHGSRLARDRRIGLRDRGDADRRRRRACRAPAAASAARLGSSARSARAPCVGHVADRARRHERAHARRRRPVGQDQISHRAQLLEQALQVARQRRAPGHGLRRSRMHAARARRRAAPGAETRCRGACRGDRRYRRPADGGCAGSARGSGACGRSRGGTRPARRGRSARARGRWCARACRDA